MRTSAIQLLGCLVGSTAHPNILVVGRARRQRQAGPLTRTDLLDGTTRESAGIRRVGASPSSAHLITRDGPSRRITRDLAGIMSRLRLCGLALRGFPPTSHQPTSAPPCPVFLFPRSPPLQISSSQLQLTARRRTSLQILHSGRRVTADRSVYGLTASPRRFPQPRYLDRQRRYPTFWAGGTRCRGHHSNTPSTMLARRSTKAPTP